MKLLEYQAKQLLRDHKLPVPKHRVIKDISDIQHVSLPAVLKVQIPKGGRGKAGGIKPVHEASDLQPTAEQLLGSEILGCRVQVLLAEEMLEIKRELYLSMTIDRAEHCVVLLAHKQGGVEIENVADETNPLLRQTIDDKPTPAQTRELAGYFELDASTQKTLARIVKHMYELLIKEDAIIVEVNPLILTKDNQLVCADAKIELDMSAHFRHQKREFGNAPANSQFVTLAPGGTVASMANGAGLAMATVDAIKTAGAEPANFYDVGGGTNVEGMVKAFQAICDMPNVQSIVVNIFGGITRCDEVAEAITKAKEVCENLPKLFIRLTGTNEAEGKAILEKAGIAFHGSLAECVDEAVR